MKNRPVKIDELTVSDHTYLSADDECYYFGSYYKDYNNPNNDNSIIHNIKKKPSTSGSPGYHYKQRDIRIVASIFREAFSAETLNSATFIPIPPSKIKGHPDYDDRMSQILQLAFNGKGADIRELIEQIESTEPAHSLDVRPTINEIEQNITINENLSDDLKETVILVDDVLTNGTHFKAIKNVLLRRFPNKRVVGVFICRRVPIHEDFDF